jgi:Tfp pilus assembly protein PilN
MNLLPQQKKDDIQKEIFLKFLTVILALVSFWSSVILVLILNAILYISAQIPAIEERMVIEQGSTSAQVYEGLKEQINELNTTLAQVDKIRNRGLFDPVVILSEVSSVVPDGITLKNLSYREDVLVLSGHANLREQVLSLKKSLENDALCASVTSAEITQEFDVEFNFTCSLVRD